MKKDHLDNFTKGWIVGNFRPALIKSDKIEVGLKKYNAGDSEKKHTHKIATEYTIAVSGVFEMNGEILKEGDMLKIEPCEAAEFRCLESGITVVIKTPSVPGDKYLET